MASRYCTRCGREAAAGKRFCGGCGQAVPDEASARRATVVEAAAPGNFGTAESGAASSALCGKCGAALMTGKRFCIQCGQAVAGAAEVAAAGASLAEPLERPAARKTEVVEQAAPIPEWKPVEPPLPPAPVLPGPLPGRDEAPKRMIGAAIGFAAVVLLGACGAWAWHVYAHRAGTQPAAATAPAQSASPGGSPAPGEAAKPSAGTPAPKAAAMPQMPAGAAPAPAPVPVPAPSVARQDAGPLRHGDPAGPTPVFHPAQTQLPAQPAPNHSGLLHYQGPPVAYGGTVVFDNLPKARLRFSFDNAAWRMTIKVSPDGSKRVILVSLKQGYQTSCELGWEIVE